MRPTVTLRPQLRGHQPRLEEDRLRQKDTLGERPECYPRPPPRSPPETSNRANQGQRRYSLRRTAEERFGTSSFQYNATPLSADHVFRSGLPRKGWERFKQRGGYNKALLEDAEKLIKGGRGWIGLIVFLVADAIRLDSLDRTGDNNRPSAQATQLGTCDVRLATSSLPRKSAYSYIRRYDKAGVATVKERRTYEEG